MAIFYYNNLNYNNLKIKYFFDKGNNSTFRFTTSGIIIPILSRKEQGN